MTSSKSSSSEVISFPPASEPEKRKTPAKKPVPVTPKPTYTFDYALKSGRRIRDAMRECETEDTTLNKIRELIVGPFQRLGEARFEEMLDILSEQDTGAKKKMEELQKSLDKIKTYSLRLGDLCTAISHKVETLDERQKEDRIATQAGFDTVMSKLRKEFEENSQSIADRLEENIRALEQNQKKELGNLGQTVSDHVDNTKVMIGKAQSETMMSLEARIAQWRAEIEDDRKQDVQEVASSLMDIGKRLMALRGPQLG